MRPSLAEIDGVFNKASAFQNRDVLYKSEASFVSAPYGTAGAYGSLYTVGMPVHGIGGYSWWFDSVPPSSVSATVASFVGGVPVGTWIYTVSMTGADGGETIVSNPSAPVTSSSGNQKVNVTWTGSLGAYSYNVYRCNTSGSPGCTAADGTITPQNTNRWYRVGQHVSGATFADTIASPVDANLPQVSGTGSTIINSTGAYAPFFEAPPITVSRLPPAAAGNAGQIRRVTDSTKIAAEGQTCEGGGSGAALAFSNGVVWKCF
jgi:hypothetical protein